MLIFSAIQPNAFSLCNVSPLRTFLARSSSLPTEMLYRELQAGDNLSLLHFVNLFPRGAIHLSHFSTSRFYLSLPLFSPLILALSLVLPIVPISLFLSLPLSIRLSCGACTISISCGYPVADSRHESRHHPAGVCRGNAKRQTGSPSPFSPSSTSAYPTSLSLSLSLSLFLRINLYLVLSYRLSPVSLSLLFLLPFSQPAYPPKGGGPGDETDPTRISGAIEANRGRMSNAALSTSLVRVLVVGSIFFPALPRDPKA